MKVLNGGRAVSEALSQIAGDRCIVLYDQMVFLLKNGVNMVHWKSGRILPRNGSTMGNRSGISA